MKRFPNELEKKFPEYKKNIPAINKTDTEQKKVVLYIFSSENYICCVRLWSTCEAVHWSERSE